MKLSVNNQVNLETKKASLKLMAGGPSKVKQPNSHPANLIHKQATEAQGFAEIKPKQTPVTSAPAIQEATTTATKTKSVDSHHVNKTLVVVGALGRVYGLRSFLRSLSMKKATTASMSSQACSPRKDRTCPADLNMKLTIDPIRPGGREPNF